MKKFFNVPSVRLFGIVAIVAVIGFTMIACNKSGSSSSGGKTLNSPEALKEYLDSQPANGPDKPIKVSMTINNPMLKSVLDVINSTGKYVSLNITGSALTYIPNRAFDLCETIVGLTIPNSVTSIGDWAFAGTGLNSITIPASVISIGDAAFAVCYRLTSVTFQGTISSSDFDSDAFHGDLREKYLAGGIGTYTTTAPVNENSKWTKQ